MAIPLPPLETECRGIHQSDIIIRSAIQAALADMRANPWLLDYVFASVPRDALTKEDYASELDQAKKWFTSNDIRVVMRGTIDEAKLPAVSIGLMESVEDANTLGDIHHQPSEASDSAWPVSAGPFAIASYAPDTGLVTVPSTVGDTLDIATGMLLLDNTGTPHTIGEVLDDYTFYIEAGIRASFSRAIIKEAALPLLVNLESLVFRETYSIGCHVSGEPVHLTYLHSIVTFALLRYKQDLLEARGFERSTLSSSDFRGPLQDEMYPEFVFSRYINVVGYVRQSWPKLVAGKVASVETRLKHQEPEPETDVDSLLWTGGGTFDPISDFAAD